MRTGRSDCCARSISRKQAVTLSSPAPVTTLVPYLSASSIRTSLTVVFSHQSSTWRGCKMVGGKRNRRGTGGMIVAVKSGTGFSPEMLIEALLDSFARCSIARRCGDPQRRQQEQGRDSAHRDRRCRVRSSTQLYFRMACHSAIAAAVATTPVDSERGERERPRQGSAAAKALQTSERPPAVADRLRMDR